MFEKIKILKEMKYYPDTILDIGAHKGTWTEDMLKIYDKCNYFLFEAIDYKELEKFKSNDKINVNNVLLGEKEETVNWYQMKNTGDSIFREKTYHFDNCEILKKNTITLDSYIEEKKILQNSNDIFIKIDCQGSEIPILKGSKKILEKTNFILLEIPLFGQYNEGVPDFLEHIKFMNEIGFVPYDILENHYINGFNMQIDILFINKKHYFNFAVNKLLKMK